MLAVHVRVSRVGKNSISTCQQSDGEHAQTYCSRSMTEGNCRYATVGLCMIFPFLDWLVTFGNHPILSCGILLSEIPQNRKTVFPSTLGPLATEKHLHKHKLANLSLMCAMIVMTTSHFTTCLFLFAFMEMSSQVNTVSFARRVWERAWGNCCVFVKHRSFW